MFRLKNAYKVLSVWWKLFQKQRLENLIKNHKKMWGQKKLKTEIATRKVLITKGFVPLIYLSLIVQ